VLETYGRNFKALFRRGVSYRSMAQIRNDSSGEADNSKGLAAGMFMAPEEWAKRRKRLLILAYQDVHMAHLMSPSDESVSRMLDAIKVNLATVGVTDPLEMSSPVSAPSSPHR